MICLEDAWLANGRVQRGSLGAKLTPKTSPRKPGLENLTGRTWLGKPGWENLAGKLKQETNGLAQPGIPKLKSERQL